MSDYIINKPSVLITKGLYFSIYWSYDTNSMYEIMLSLNSSCGTQYIQDIQRKGVGDWRIGLIDFIPIASASYTKYWGKKCTFRTAYACGILLKWMVPVTMYATICRSSLAKLVIVDKLLFNLLHLNPSAFCSCRLRQLVMSNSFYFFAALAGRHQPHPQSYYQCTVLVMI